MTIYILNKKLRLQFRSLISMQGRQFSLFSFFSLPTPTCAHPENKTQQRWHSSLGASLQPHSQTLEQRQSSDWHWRKLRQVCFISRRSFIDLFGKRVYSGRLWETELCNKVNFYLFLLIGESTRVGWALESLFFGEKKTPLFGKLSGHKSNMLKIQMR